MAVILNRWHFLDIFKWIKVNILQLKCFWRLNAIVLLESLLCGLEEFGCICKWFSLTPKMFEREGFVLCVISFSNKYLVWTELLKIKLKLAADNKIVSNWEAEMCVEGGRSCLFSTLLFSCWGLGSRHARWAVLCPVRRRGNTEHSPE